jgi:hypothetical protein
MSFSRMDQLFDTIRYCNNLSVPLPSFLHVDSFSIDFALHTYEIDEVVDEHQIFLRECAILLIKSHHFRVQPR